MARLLKATAPIPFASEGQDWFLPMLLGLLQYLLIILLLVFFVFNGLVQRWDSTLRGHITLEVLQSDPAQNIIEPILAFVKVDPAVLTAEAVSDQAMAVTLRPWLGNISDDVIQNLPLPRLIDIELKPKTKFDAGNLLLQLQQKFPEQAIDFSNGWANDILSLVKALRVLAVFILGFIVFVIAAAVFFVVRSRLRIHHDEIDLLHIMGASDAFIARLFQRQIVWAGMKGVFIALAGFGITILAFVLYNYWQSSTLLADQAAPMRAMLLPFVVAVIVMPLVVIFISATTARISVKNFLKVLF